MATPDRTLALAFPPYYNEGIQTEVSMHGDWFAYAYAALITLVFFLAGGVVIVTALYELAAAYARWRRRNNKGE